MPSGGGHIGLQLARGACAFLPPCSTFENFFEGLPMTSEIEPSTNAIGSHAAPRSSDEVAVPTARKTDWITFASVVSAVSVVLLHTDGCYWTFSSTEMYWKTANIIDAVFYFAVPVFFMISATTLLDFNERYSLGTYFKKRITKTVIPYVFWSLFGVAFQVFYLETVDASEVTLSYLLEGLTGGSLVSIYWFFIPLFSVYLSIPLFAAVPEERRKSVFTYISVASFFICGVVPLAVTVFELPISTSLTIGVGASYLFFVPTGYLLSHYEVGPKVKAALYASGLVGLIIHIVGTYELSMEAGSVVRTFKGYTNVPSMMYSVAIFLLLKDAGGRSCESTGSPGSCSS